MLKSYFKSRIPFIDIENYDYDFELAKIIPEETNRRYQVIGIEKFDYIDGCSSFFTVGMVNPGDLEAISILENRFKCKVLPIRINAQQWANIINQLYKRI